MRVSLEHLELFVPADCGDLGDVQALFEESRNRLMSQIMKVEVIHSGAIAEMFEGEAD